MSLPITLSTSKALSIPEILGLIISQLAPPTEWDAPDNAAALLSCALLSSTWTEIALRHRCIFPNSNLVISKLIGESALGRYETRVLAIDGATLNGEGGEWMDWNDDLETLVERCRGLTEVHLVNLDWLNLSSLQVPSLIGVQKFILASWMNDDELWEEYSEAAPPPVEPITTSTKRSFLPNLKTFSLALHPSQEVFVRYLHLNFPSGVDSPLKDLTLLASSDDPEAIEEAVRIIKYLNPLVANVERCWVPHLPGSTDTGEFVYFELDVLLHHLTSLRQLHIFHSPHSPSLPASPHFFISKVLKEIRKPLITLGLSYPIEAITKEFLEGLVDEMKSLERDKDLVVEFSDVGTEELENVEGWVKFVKAMEEMNVKISAKSLLDSNDTEVA